MPIIGKIVLCSSARSKICDEQGIGSYALWTRYASLEPIVAKHIPEQYRSFFAQPQSVKDSGEEEIFWHTEPSRIGDVPTRLTKLSGDKRLHYEGIKNKTIAVYQQAIDACLKSTPTDAEYFQKALKHVGEFDDCFYCFDDKVVVVLWSMRPRDISDFSNTIVEKIVVPNISYTVNFDIGEYGHTDSSLIVRKRPMDSPIQSHQIPNITPIDGYIFKGWDKNPLNYKVQADTTFIAIYKQIVPTVIGESLDPPSPPVPPIQHNVRFEDKEGELIKEYQVNDGEVLDASYIPLMSNSDKEVFKGWDNDINQPIHSDMVFRPHFDAKPLSWWERFKIWWKEKGCFKWLIRVLLLLLLLLLLIFLMHRCDGGGCTSRIRIPNDSYNGINPFLPGIPGGGGIPPVPGDGFAYPPISPDDPGMEHLPSEPNMPVPIDDGDLIDDEDSSRKIVANRLNVLLDDESLSINEFAVDFKNIYSGDEYQIIYADPLIKRLQLQVPSDERVQIKQELLQRLPDKYNIDNTFIWDEALMVSSYVPNDRYIGECWHHNAIRTYAAWDSSMGNEEIIVAVLDDGFNINHEEFEGKIIKPYNVFDKSTRVEESKHRHGTHVAGIAVATANNHVGIAGVAPNCKLMPVKVFDDNGYSSVLPVLDGVLYAIYNGADVINLSLGMMLQADIPVIMQEQLINSYFKEEERVWNKVFEIANRYNTTIVIAAGNENILAGIEPMHRSENVIVVAAVNDKNTPMYHKSDFSNYGSYTDVSAPGLNIISTIGRNKYESMSGTSMAAPIVTGAVALMKSINDSLSTLQIKAILQKTGIAVDGNVGPLIQLDKAIEYAKNPFPDSIDSHPEPSTGSVQILLEWFNHNDLDLICQDPNGDIVWYKQKKVPSGGMLEIDMNAEGGRFSTSPIENIYWQKGMAPKGNYSVKVLYYKRHDSQHASSNYTVTVRYGSHTQTYRGTARTQQETISICQFTYE